jgi:hypothetical protein
MGKGRPNNMTVASQRPPLPYARGPETSQNGAKVPVSATSSSVGVRPAAEFAERRTAVPPSRIGRPHKVVLLGVMLLVGGWTVALAALVYQLFARV